MANLENKILNRYAKPMIYAQYSGYIFILAKKLEIQSLKGALEQLNINNKSPF